MNARLWNERSMHPAEIVGEKHDETDEPESTMTDMEKRLEWLCDEWASAQDDNTLEAWRDVRMAIHGASLALVYCSADDRHEDRIALMEMSALALQHSQDCISAGRYEGADDHETTGKRGDRREITMETKFTPGPWMVADDDDDLVVVSDKLPFIATLHPSTIDGVTEANARLIAAAPDLLAALKEIVALDDGDKPDLWHFETEFDAARAAISKATGD